MKITNTVLLADVPEEAELFIDRGDGHGGKDRLYPVRHEATGGVWIRDFRDRHESGGWTHYKAGQ